MSAQFAYLETQVFTASPQNLRHLLIQAALRTAQKSLQRWSVPLREKESHRLTLLRRIITQLLTSLGEGNNESVGNLRNVYLYLFQTVTEAQLSGDAGKIRDVVRVLEVEQETWRVLAERHPSQGVDDPSPQSSSDQPRLAPTPSTYTAHGQKCKRTPSTTSLCLVA